MIIEQKKISPKELLLFFPKSLPIIGSFYATSANIPDLDIIKNICATNLAQTILLTSDFAYIEATSDKSLDDLEAITIAEIDDFYTSQTALLHASNENIIEKITIILKTIVAPFLQRDGGDIKLDNYQNQTVTVQFLGKCHGCPYAKITLKERVEKNLLRYLPEIKEVVLK